MTATGRGHRWPTRPDRAPDHHLDRGPDHWPDRGVDQRVDHWADRGPDHAVDRPRVTHQIPRPPAPADGELMVQDNAQPDGPAFVDYPRWLALVARFRFFRDPRPSLLDRVEYAMVGEYTMRLDGPLRKAHLIFAYVALLPAAVLRFIEWAYLERFARAVFAVFLTPVVFMLLNALPLTHWVVPDGADPVGAWFRPDPTPELPIPAPDLPAPDLPVDGAPVEGQ